MICFRFLIGLFFSSTISSFSWKFINRMMMSTLNNESHDDKVRSSFTLARVVDGNFDSVSLNNREHNPIWFNGMKYKS